MLKEIKLRVELNGINYSICQKDGHEPSFWKLVDNKRAGRCIAEKMADGETVSALKAIHKRVSRACAVGK